MTKYVFLINHNIIAFIVSIMEQNIMCLDFLSFDPVLIPHWAASKGLRNCILSVLEAGNLRAQHQHGCVLVRAFSWVADLVSSHSGTQRELRASQL